jgi:hypothetical protein
MKLAYVEYRSNNSGGSWWLTDENWKALEAAGWEVDWYANQKNDTFTYRDGRWMSALATKAVRRNVTMREVVEEFECVTGQDVSDEGCNCCGRPHNFTGYDENNQLVHYGPKFETTRTILWGSNE